MLLIRRRPLPWRQAQHRVDDLLGVDSHFTIRSARTTPDVELQMGRKIDEKDLEEVLSSVIALPRVSIDGFLGQGSVEIVGTNEEILHLERGGRSLFELAEERLWLE